MGVAPAKSASLVKCRLMRRTRRNHAILEANYDWHGGRRTFGATYRHCRGCARIGADHIRHHICLISATGVANATSGQRSAQWIGPGGLYTLSIDSAHSLLTLEQAAALLVPVDLAQLQASLIPTATVTPQPPATGTGASDSRGEGLVILGGAILLLASSLSVIGKLAQ